MTKLFIIFILFISQSFFGQNFQGLQLKIDEKLKEGHQPLSNEDVLITINDSITLKMKTQADGSLEKIATASGSKTVKIDCKNCQSAQVKGIIVGEGKIAYLTVGLSCAAYFNSLSKKEKRKMGYKVK
ncbi:MAG: hypothetical protein Q8L81_06555 [Bacteroidota bacterium]|nr:hypothetical protein [Bacteroidota bacterium]